MQHCRSPLCRQLGRSFNHRHQRITVTTTTGTTVPKNASATILSCFSTGFPGFFSSKPPLGKFTFGETHERRVRWSVPVRYERVHSELRRRKDLVIADSDKLTEEKILGARGCVSNDGPSERVHWSRYFYKQTQMKKSTIVSSFGACGMACNKGARCGLETCAH